VTPAQLRERSWWKGAEGFILVDDYDLVATSQGNPLEPLLPAPSAPSTIRAARMRVAS
jgi:S-DNA-T family DNA segregation ATPase FtsK/SpoIIIE